jgi:hypothetical protein
MTFYDAGLPVVTLPDFEFKKFTSLKCIAQVATLKEQLDWEIKDFEAYQTIIKDEINSLVN